MIAVQIPGDILYIIVSFVEDIRTQLALALVSWDVKAIIDPIIWHTLKYVVGNKRPTAKCRAALDNSMSHFVQEIFIGFPWATRHHTGPEFKPMLSFLQRLLHSTSCVRKLTLVIASLTIGQQDEMCGLLCNCKCLTRLETLVVDEGVVPNLTSILQFHSRLPELQVHRPDFFRDTLRDTSPSTSPTMSPDCSACTKYRHPSRSSIPEAFTACDYGTMATLRGPVEEFFDLRSHSKHICIDLGPSPELQTPAVASLVRQFSSAVTVHICVTNASNLAGTDTKVSEAFLDSLPDLLSLEDLHWIGADEGAQREFFRRALIGRLPLSLKRVVFSWEDRERVNVVYSVCVAVNYRRYRREDAVGMWVRECFESWKVQSI